MNSSFITSRPGVYFKSNMSTDFRLMSSSKNNRFHLREAQMLHICKHFVFVLKQAINK